MSYDTSSEPSVEDEDDRATLAARDIWRWTSSDAFEFPNAVDHEDADHVIKDLKALGNLKREVLWFEYSNVERVDIEAMQKRLADLVEKLPINLGIDKPPHIVNRARNAESNEYLLALHSTLDWLANTAFPREHRVTADDVMHGFDQLVVLAALKHNPGGARDIDESLRHRMQSQHEEVEHRIEHSKPW